jgi:hypothetical protein
MIKGIMAAEMRKSDAGVVKHLLGTAGHILLVRRLIEGKNDETYLYINRYFTFYSS